MDLVAGGYGTPSGHGTPDGSGADADTPTAPLAMRQQFSSSGGAGLTLDFTPRATGTLFSQPVTSGGDVPASLSFGLQNAYGEGLRFDSIGLSGASSQSFDGLALGGALNVDEWQVSGSVGRANLLGGDSDVFAAGLGYGRVNARLVYGHVPEPTTGLGGDVLMLSTDLAALSWLTLQGDVAVSETPGNEPLTVGRIGVRLDF